MSIFIFANHEFTSDFSLALSLTVRILTSIILIIFIYVISSSLYNQPPVTAAPVPWCGHSHIPTCALPPALCSPLHGC